MNHDENILKGNRQYDILTKGRKKDTFIVTSKPALKRIIILIYLYFT